MHTVNWFAASISAAICMSATAAFAVSASGEIEDCDCTPACIESYVAQFKEEFTANEAERVSRHCGESAVDPLRKLLKSDEVAITTKGFVLLCLGKIGTTECETALMEFVQTPRTELVSDEQRISVLMALYGLGFTGSEEAIEFLRLLCTEEYWLKREDSAMWVPLDGKLNEARKWQSSAIAGMSALEPEKSIHELERLRADETYKTFFPSIDGAIAATKEQLKRERSDGDAPQETQKVVR